MRITKIQYILTALFTFFCGVFIGGCTTSNKAVKFNQNYIQAKVLVYCELVTDKAEDFYFNKTKYRPQTINTVRLLLEEAHPICSSRDIAKDLPSALKLEGIYNQLLNKLNNSVIKE